MIQSTAPKNGETNGKRAREDDGAAAPPAKKIDTKTEA
jgi:lupus La protein